MKFAYLLLMLFIISISFAGCIQVSDREPFQSNEPGTIPHFTEFWNHALKLSGIQNETTCFEDISLHMDGNKTIDHMSMEFSAVKQQQRNLYRLDLVPSKGTVIVSSRGVDQEQREIPGTHPLVILTALEQFPYSSFETDSNSLTFWAFRLGSYHGGFDDREFDIYELDNGTLIPIKTIIFCSPAHDVFPIVVSRDMRADKGGVGWPPRDGNSFFMFTAGDVAKAGTVIYKTNGSAPAIRKDRITCPMSELTPAGRGGGSGGGGGGSSPAPGFNNVFPISNPSDTNLKSIAVSVEKQGQNIVIKNNGGPDALEVTSFAVSIDGRNPIIATSLGTAVGKSQSFPGTSGMKNEVRINATFKDGSQQLILDIAV
jgi:hypothetical protein